jgi:hypothetical protein
MSPKLPQNTAGAYCTDSRGSGTIVCNLDTTQGMCLCDGAECQALWQTAKRVVPHSSW